ncbi:MAG: HlyD family efflux transporter periplasmic adaptor subunit [Planctomycetes bacterium]|nr:HlyD family efflux transporter periplasmic adaptor subunit [Planctomycetota bacterium]
MIGEKGDHEKNLRREQPEMISRDHAGKRDARHGRKPYRMAGTAVLVVALGLVALWFKVVHGGEDPVSSVPTVAVKRGPLTISVLEAGALKAKDPEIIRSGLQGRATIISIVPEGTRVDQGDLLVELDVSKLVDHRVDHEIMVKNAEASFINARENLTIITSQAQSNVELAELALDFARQDLEKYTGQGGDYENALAAAQGKIKLNAEEKTKAEDYLEWSQKLFSEKYLSKTQLQADQLALQRADLNLQVASNDANLLKKYTYKRRIAQLTSDVTQAERALERAQARARANIAQATATLGAYEQQYRRYQELLAKLDDQIRQGKIYAPTDGMVIYATSSMGGHMHDDRRPLADGVEVWERQELIYLPRTSSIIAEVAVHEASLQKVRVGLPAIVTVDALLGRKLMGTVTRIAPLPDAQSMWTNPDLKVYKAEIALDSNDISLRSGMNCKAEIVVEQYADAVYVPLETVLRVGGQPTVYVLQEAGVVEERPIETALDNNSVIRVARGLQEGELVLLKPPLKAGTVEPGARLAGIRGAATDDMVQQIRAKLKEADTAKPWTPRTSPEPPGPVSTTSLADGGAGRISAGGRPDQNANRTPGSERTE